MDRVQFIGQTRKGHMISNDELIVFYDHIMCAYDILGAMNNISSDGVNDMESSLKIKAITPNTSEIDNIVQYVENILYNEKEVYGKTFHIDAYSHDSFVELNVRQI